MVNINNVSYPQLKKTKVSNSIVIGGMIAFGKSTLAQAVSNKITNSKVVNELDESDLLAKMLLDKMYERKNNTIFGSVFQLYFVLNRFEIYKANCNNLNLTIFDRSIFEDWIFAHENIIRPSVFTYYDSLWKDIATELVYQHGVPKLYVILSGDWQLFKERLFLRNRKSEIENYQKNEVYFKKLLTVYQEYMINVCLDFGVDYIVVDAKMPLDQKVDIVIKKYQELNGGIL